MMKINEIVINPPSVIGALPHSDKESVRVWVPSDWVEVRSFSWEGRLHRYHVWQRLREVGYQGRFNFDQAFDSAMKKTAVSAMQLAEGRLAQLPVALQQVDCLTAPKIMAHQLMPYRSLPFALLAYRWLGHIELCAYRHGLLQYAHMGGDGAAGALGLWSRVIQTMPVLAAAPLYTLDEGLTSLFQAHHGACHTVPYRNTVLGRCFKKMGEAQP